MENFSVKLFDKMDTLLKQFWEMGALVKEWSPWPLTPQAILAFVVKEVLWIVTLFIIRRGTQPNRPRQTHRWWNQLFSHIILTMVDSMVVLFCEYRIFETDFMELYKIGVVVLLYIRYYMAMHKIDFFGERRPINPFADIPFPDPTSGSDEASSSDHESTSGEGSEEKESPERRYRVYSYSRRSGRPWGFPQEEPTPEERAKYEADLERQNEAWRKKRGRKQ